MEQQVIFREYQEQTAGDHNNIQDFTRRSFDHLTNDAVTKTNRYAGFAVVKTAQIEVQVAAGRMYDQNGAIFARNSSLSQSLTSHLPAAAKRIVAVSCYGQEIETDTQERDFLVNTETGATQPDAVSMSRSRTAVLAFTAGAESADPQPPPIPATHAIIAYILLDTLSIVSIDMQTDNAVISTEALHVRTKALEAWRAAVEPRIDGIASDVAAIANDVQSSADGYRMDQIYRDIARVKSAIAIPDLASDYGADHFLDHRYSDVDNAQDLGFNAKVEEGIRFAPDAEDVTALNIFSANDPNAALNAGLLLPAYDHALKMEIGPYHSDIGIAQYGFQTYEIVQRMMSRMRLRYGPEQTICTNSQWWQSGAYNPAEGILLKGNETWQVLGQAPGMKAKFLRVRQVFEDWYEEPYWEGITVDHSISGAQVSQSFLQGNDMWATRLGFYLTVKAANENIHLSLVEVTNGVPDLQKCILQQTVPHEALASNGWTEINIMPTFLRAGGRYAIVLTSNANHRVGMAYGQSYLDGTFFYSTDGAYHQGDLTKDMMIRVYGAKFRASQVAIELDAISLSGGIQNIDILAGTIQPSSTELVYEIQPGGSGAWRRLTVDDLGALSSTPALCRFRARFVGTRDMMPGINLVDSEVRVSRPKTTLTHISKPWPIENASNKITVQLLLEDFDPTPHDVNCRLRIAGAWVTADTITTRLVTAEDKRWQRTYVFELDDPVTEFTTEVTATTNHPSTTFHVAEFIFWAGA
ncbi:hypothetical protein [Hyphomicrobium sulfonivorans]|uniref:hypothetical protein n=1 Tax=Hyphomicrobium sulfonivorans TaxID=121290 RepID=UPI00156F6C6A|nr:hypothetical protein [Hyphomicrobium sulfonivorans]MBI1649879.1 hypothetical protein [Hyphomicrobium sulfonivorans]NSL71790.1 hypothetical protein [Hyphomicrobium sulfonivorans]